MKILLLTGFGPVWPAANSFWDSDTLSGTFFDRKALSPVTHPGLGRALRTENFYYRTGAESRPLFRLRSGSEPHLTTETLVSILDGCGRDYELFDLKNVWSGQGEPVTTDPDVVALSTTFICNRRALNMAVRWISDRYPCAKLILGGQYSNLKYMRLMREIPEIDYIVRGDAEVAFPMLLDAIDAKADLGKVPNLVLGGPGREHREVKVNDLIYIDFNSYPSPSLRGFRPVVPYESMRGCPFTCKFCSFPFASPQWRYKSSDKICHDWKTYARENGATLIKALDSTFTVPPSRFRELLDKLPGVGIKWEAYTRANVITSRDVVSALEASQCATLSIGFESMSDASLKRMHKQVSAAQNRRAAALLADSAVDYRSSFIIGYPGETTEEYELTHRFLVDEYERRFLLSVFSLTDETMPVWDDAETYQLEVADLEDPDSDWKHIGMDVATARALHQRTLLEVRWKNEHAVTVLWQIPFELPLVPGLGLRENYRVEKLLERLAFLPQDFAEAPERIRAMTAPIVDELGQFGIYMS